MKTDQPQDHVRSASRLTALILAGGKGTRLASVSNGVPKGLITIDKANSISGVEHISRILNELGIDEVHMLVSDQAEHYSEFAANKSYKLLSHPHPDTGNGVAVEHAIKMLGTDKQYLVIACDTYVSADDVERLISNHVAGAISWGVSNLDPETLMDSYYGLVVDSQNNVIGDLAQQRWTELALDRNRLFVKGAVQIIDAGLYLKAMRFVREKASLPELADLYWDVMPWIIEYNLMRVSNGSRSIMNAIIFEDDLIDYGTPERLEITRKKYNPKSTVRTRK